MRRNGWHITCEDGVYTLSRRRPARFDVAARTVLPLVRKDRLARQIRQDLWRELQDLKGFAPVVRVAEEDGALEVTAGGAVDGAFPRAGTEARIAAVLEDPDKRARWQRWAV